MGQSTYTDTISCPAGEAKVLDRRDSQYCSQACVDRGFVEANGPAPLPVAHATNFERHGEAELTGDVLLVAGHGMTNSLGVGAEGDANGEAELHQQRGNARAAAGREDPAAFGHGTFSEQAEADRLAMQQLITGHLLERVSHGVTGIRRGSGPGLALITRHDGGLDLDAPADEDLERGRVARRGSASVFASIHER